jgi:hypothetical protein
MTYGDGGTALEEAESRIHLVEGGFPDYILAPGDMFFVPSGKSMSDFQAMKG